MKITVDRERCTGHGRCYSLAPEVYEPDDDGYCQHAASITSAALAEQARVGARNCPEDAITVIAEQGDPR
jgi:ferredoxin